MSKKISCGGFYIDENDFNISEEGELSLKPNGGAASLPSVTSSDNGKVLRVVSGRGRKHLCRVQRG